MLDTAEWQRNPHATALLLLPLSFLPPCAPLLLPHHGNDGAAADVVNKSTKEGLAGQVGIVLLCQGALHVHHLQALERVAALLEALDDVANQTTLDAIRLCVCRARQGEQRVVGYVLRPPR